MVNRKSERQLHTGRSFGAFPEVPDEMQQAHMENPIPWE